MILSTSLLHLQSVTLPAILDIKKLTHRQECKCVPIYTLGAPPRDPPWAPDTHHAPTHPAARSLRRVPPGPGGRPSPLIATDLVLPAPGTPPAPPAAAALPLPAGRRGPPGATSSRPGQSLPRQPPRSARRGAGWGESRGTPAGTAAAPVPPRLARTPTRVPLPPHCIARGPLPPPQTGGERARVRAKPAQHGCSVPLPRVPKSLRGVCPSGISQHNTVSGFSNSGWHKRPYW